jgi:hypothetical protein
MPIVTNIISSTANAKKHLLNVKLDKKSPLMLVCGAVFGVSLEKMSKNSEYSLEKVYLYSETRRWSISLLNENPRKQVAFGGKNADTVVLDNMPYSIMQNYVK